MALKIEFSSSLKDADTVIRTLQELNREFDHLKDASAAIGQQGTKGFADLGKSIQNFEQLAKSTKSVKEFTDSLKAITGSNSDLLAFSRSFTDFGRSVNSALGDASGVLLKRLKDNIKDLKSETDRHTADAKAAHDLMKEARSEEERDFLRRERGESGVMADEADRRARDAARIASRYTPLAETAVGRAMGLDPGSRLGALTYAAATSTAGQLGLAYGAGTLLASGINSAAQQETNVSFAPFRAEAARRRLAMRPGEEALQGDPTQAVLQQLGIGPAAQYQRGDRTLGELIQLAMSGGIGATIGIGAGALLAPMTGGLSLAAGLGFAGYSLAHPTTGVQAQQLAARMGLSQDMFEKTFQPGYTRMNRLFTEEETLYRTLGDKGTLDLVRGMGAGGVSERFGKLERTLIAQYGLNPEMAGGALTGSERDFALQRQRLGVSDDFMTQMVRARVHGGLTAGQANYETGLAISVSGLQDVAARQTFSQSIASMVSGQGGTMDFMGATAATAAAVKAITAGGVTSQQEAAAIGGDLANRVTSEYGDVTSLAGTLLDQRLISMGVRDPMTRTMIRKMVQNHEEQRAMKAALFAGQKTNPKLTMGAVQGAFASAAEADIGALGSLTSQSFKDTARAAGVDPSTFLKTGRLYEAEASGGKGSPVEAALRGQFGGLPQGVMAPATTRETEMDRIEAARAGRESAEMDAYRATADKLGKSLASAIIAAIQQSTQELTSKTFEITNPKPKPVQGGYAAAKLGNY